MILRSEANALIVVETFVHKEHRRRSEDDTEEARLEGQGGSIVLTHCFLSAMTTISL